MKKQTKRSLMTKSALIILLLILPFNVISIITSAISYRDSIKSTETAISYTLDSYASLLDNQMYNTNSMLYELTANNSTLFSMCNTQNDSSYMLQRQQLFTSLKEQMQVANVADAIFLYVSDRDDYIQAPGYTAKTAGTKPYYSYIENYDLSYSNWFLSEENTLLLRILHDRSMDVYFGAAIDLSDFLAQLDGLEGYDTLHFSFAKEFLEDTGAERIFNHSIAPGVYLDAALGKSELNSNINTLQYGIFFFFIVYLALIPMLILLMRKHVVLPLKTLNQAHTQLKEGNEDYRIAEKADTSEFYTAYDSFNTMAASIQELNREVLEKELSNKQLQIDFLQLQIRPHFLLNSFNVLYTLIQNGKKDSAQKMVLFLSDYFRYLFRSGRELQLFSKERQMIESYLDITRIYYPTSFDVSYQIDPVIDLMRVPPLLLHSFIENIIAHALLPDRKVHIIFSGEYDEGLVTFYISDDGKGIDEEALASIRHIDRLPIDDGKNVGIKNSIRRLKYYYGENASVECESELNVGTTFTITIPYNLEDE